MFLQRFQLEDTINELNRRISMQQESHTGRKGEFDAVQRKLKERNDALLKVTAEYQVHMTVSVHIQLLYIEFGTK